MQIPVPEYSPDLASAPGNQSTLIDNFSNFIQTEKKILQKSVRVVIQREHTTEVGQPKATNTYNTISTWNAHFNLPKLCPSFKTQFRHILVSELISVVVNLQFRVHSPFSPPYFLSCLCFVCLIPFLTY